MKRTILYDVHKIEAVRERVCESGASVWALSTHNYKLKALYTHAYPEGPYSIVIMKQIAISGYLRYVPWVNSDKGDYELKMGVIESEDGTLLLEGVFYHVPVAAKVHLSNLPTLDPQLKVLQSVHEFPISIHMASVLCRDLRHRRSLFGSLAVETASDDSYLISVGAFALAKISSDSISTLRHHFTVESAANLPSTGYSILGHSRKHMLSVAAGLVPESTISLDKEFIRVVCGDFSLEVRHGSKWSCIRGLYRDRVLFSHRSPPFTSLGWTIEESVDANGYETVALVKDKGESHTFINSNQGLFWTGNSMSARSIFRDSVFFMTIAGEYCAFEFTLADGTIRVQEIMPSYSKVAFRRKLRFTYDLNADAKELMDVENATRHSIIDYAMNISTSTVEYHIAVQLILLGSNFLVNYGVRRGIGNAIRTQPHSGEELGSILTRLEKEIEEDPRIGDTVVPAPSQKPVELLDLVPERHLPTLSFTEQSFYMSTSTDDAQRESGTRVSSSYLQVPDRSSDQYKRVASDASGQKRTSNRERDSPSAMQRQIEHEAWEARERIERVLYLSKRLNRYSPPSQTHRRSQERTTSRKRARSSSPGPPPLKRAKKSQIIELK